MTELTTDDRIRRVLTIVQRMVGERDEGRLLRSALDAVFETVSADKGFVVIQAPGGQPRVRATRNLDQATMRSPAFRPYRKVADYVMAEGDPFISADVTGDTRMLPSESLIDRHRTILAVPLRCADHILGTIYIDRLHDGGGPYSVESRRLVQQIADLTGDFLDRLRAQRTLKMRTKSLEEVRQTLERDNSSLQEDFAAKSVELANVERALVSSNRALAIKYNFQNIVGRSPRMHQIFEVMSQVVDYPVPVLITGESGTGKELIARALHHGGLRAPHPFMAINCAAIPENLLESELFGYVRGAFTGAINDKEGLFCAAGAGTVFLDEIGDLPITLQAKLLRVLQECEVRPIGSRKSERVNARIIAATNHNLREQVAHHHFREDLYYRLNVVEIEVPPLRDRVEDIPALADHFLNRFSEELSLPRKQLSQAAVHHLMRCNWPGNIRQLENAVKSGVILSRGRVIQAHEIQLPGNSVAPQPRTVPSTAPPTLPVVEGIDTRADWEAFERQRIIDTLVACRWNKTKAAAHLGVSRRNLYRKLTRYEIEQH